MSVDMLMRAILYILITAHWNIQSKHARLIVYVDMLWIPMYEHRALNTHN